MRRFITRALVSVLVVAVQTYAFAQTAVTGSGTAKAATPEETVTTPQLMLQATTSFPTCGQWHVSGICFFLFCSMFGCKIKTSTRYSHMLPDLVVSTYSDLDNHPWQEVGIPIEKATLAASSTLLGALIGDGSGNLSEKKRRDKNVKYRDADAIGHPGGTFSGGPICPSAATAFQPYYSSFSDAMSWRNYLPVDMLRPESWVPGLREIGAWPLNTWGNVYPRAGWLVQQHDVKTGAVLSQRIADVVTHPGEPRIYTYLHSGGIVQRHGQTVFDPPPAYENNMLGGMWQMSAPFQGALSTACHVFGMNDSATPTAYGDFATSKTQSYAYTLWRPYACCKTRGMYLYSIIWGRW